MNDIIKDIAPVVEYKQLLLSIAGKTDDEKKSMHYYTMAGGGKCSFCDKPYKKVVMKNIQHCEYYEPDCDCWEEYESKEKNQNILDMLLKSADVPRKYFDCTIREMNKNIHQETKKAIEICMEYLRQKKYEKVGLFLHGDIGTGKTHIAVAIIKNLIINGKKCRFVNCSKIVKNIIDKKHYIEELIEHQYVLLDDFDKINTRAKESGWVQEQIFTLINDFVNADIKMIITANVKSIENLTSKFDSSIISRIAGNCEEVRIAGNDYRLNIKCLGV